MLLLSRVVLRRQWLANLAYLAVSAVIAGSPAPGLVGRWTAAAAAIGAGIMTVGLTRFGIVAIVVAISSGFALGLTPTGSAINWTENRRREPGRVVRPHDAVVTARAAC